MVPLKETWGFPCLRVPSVGPYNKGYSMLESILGPPMYKLPLVGDVQGLGFKEQLPI